MATSKAAQVAAQAQVVAEASQAASISFKTDDTDYVGTQTTYGMFVVGKGNSSITVNESLNVEGMMNVIFTAFNVKDPNNSGVSAGFHMTPAEATELQKFIAKKVTEKKAMGYNPNTLCFSFTSLPGRFIPDGQGGVTLKWFSGLDMSSFTFYIKMEGPELPGTSEEEAQEVAHDNYRSNVIANQYMKRAELLAKQTKGEAQPVKVRKTPAQLLAEMLDAQKVGQ